MLICTKCSIPFKKANFGGDVCAVCLLGLKRIEGTEARDVELSAMVAHRLYGWNIIKCTCGCNRYAFLSPEFVSSDKFVPAAVHDLLNNSAWPTVPRYAELPEVALRMLESITGEVGEGTFLVEAHFHLSAWWVKIHYDGGTTSPAVDPVFSRAACLAVLTVPKEKLLERK